ncbi:MAG TPA: hypothetical protein VHX86_18245 [Tepidisphaeraceae bacterium]|jgi:hypothetical protein|nr:hypothetical protein [Tepidisphaeraceae bacterium]
MDLSKLPKLSKTQEKQPPPEETGAPFPARPAVIVPTFGLAEAWVSIALGVLLLFVFPNTIRYLHSSAAFEQNNPVTDAQGNAIPYLNSVFFWTDLGITVFAAALILEGIALAAARRIFPLLIAFCVTAGAALFNVFVIVHAYSIIGFPWVCGIGVIVLVYMAITQWRLIAILRQ